MLFKVINRNNFQFGYSWTILKSWLPSCTKITTWRLFSQRSASADFCHLKRTHPSRVSSMLTWFPSSFSTWEGLTCLNCNSSRPGAWQTLHPAASNTFKCWLAREQSMPLCNCCTPNTSKWSNRRFGVSETWLVMVLKSVTWLSALMQWSLSPTFWIDHLLEAHSQGMPVGLFQICVVVDPLPNTNVSQGASPLWPRSWLKMTPKRLFPIFAGHSPTLVTVSQLKSLWSSKPTFCQESFSY